MTVAGSLSDAFMVQQGNLVAVDPVLSVSLLDWLLIIQNSVIFLLL